MSRARPSRVSTAVERDIELAVLERLRQGDPDAFDEVYAAFNTRLFTFLVRLSRRRDVAEDLLEETWLRLVRHARRLRADTRLGAPGCSPLRATCTSATTAPECWRTRRPRA